MVEKSAHFSGKVGLQQRVLPDYRIPFIDQLSAACSQGLALFAGDPRPAEAISTGRQPEKALLFKADNRHWLSGPLYLLRQPGLLDWLEGWQPDVLVLEANPRYLDNWRALSWAQRRSLPVVGWGLGAPALRDGKPVGAWLWHQFLNRFDALIAYSSKGASEYQLAGLPAERISVALNAAIDNPPETMERQPPSGRPLHLLFVGRLQPRKGVGRLLRACADLGSERVELRIVGAGPDKARLKDLADQIFPQAVFTGHQQGESLKQSFAWADLFVLPGTGGLAVQQAMAHALPVVVAKGDGTQTDLVRANNGWLVKEDSASALRETIAKALANRQQLPDMGRRGAEIVRKEINVSAMVQTFVELFQIVSGVDGQ